MRVASFYQVKSTFPQKQINSLIRDRLKEIIQFRDSIELNKLDSKAKSGKITILPKFNCLLYF